MEYWGMSSVRAGLACLGYDWVYVPFCNHIIRIEPWTITAYGVAVLLFGIALNILQRGIGAQPIAPRREI